MTRLHLAVVLALPALGCLGDTMQPHLGPQARLSVAAVFEGGAVRVVVDVTAMHLLLRRSNGQVALDTTMAVPADADSVVLDVAVPLLLTAPSNPPRERFEVRVAFSGPAGDTLFRSGPDTVEAVGAGAVNLMTAALRYVGTGYNAAAVVITPPDTLLLTGEVLQLQALALDSSGTSIPGTPIVWSVLEPAVLSLANADSIWSVGALDTGTARVVARLLTAHTDTGTIGVVPPVIMSVVAGDSQSAAVDSALATAPSVRLTTGRGTPIAGTQVTFAVTSGGGQATGLTQTTDANGVATVGSWTLGPTPTVNTLQASTDSGNVTIRATATWTRRMRLGSSTGCAIGGGGTVYCWGDNSLGEFGSTATGGPNAIPVSVPVPTLAELGQSNGRHTCGIASNGDAVCFGRNTFGELGGGAAGPVTAVTVVGGMTWAQVSTSVLSSCGVSTTGVGYCWGTNQQGEIGSAAIGLNTTNASPVPIDGGLTFASITAGWIHACGLTLSGEAYCWGDNTYGKLGIGTTGGRMLVPTPVAGGHRFEQLSAGAQHTCGVTAGKQALCWGWNGTGQLGDGTTQERMVPTPVATTQRFSVIAVNAGSNTGTGGTQLGDGSTCALTEAGEPYCWGFNGYGQLGDGAQVPRLSPVPVGGGLRLSGLSLGSSATCGMYGAAIWCWGWNDWGQLGNGTSFNTNTPSSVLGGLTYQQVAAAINGAHSCGVGAGGTAYCWGWNSSGQLGVGLAAVPILSSTPMAVSGGLSFQAVTTGTSHSCGVTSVGAAYCWGLNSTGQLGDGTSANRDAPVAVVGGLVFQSLDAGGQHTCGVTNGGLAYCWGSGLQGALGNGTTVNSNTPVAVVGGLTFQSVSAGLNHSCGLTSAGAAYCWGSNSNGVLGNGTATASTTPVAVAGGLLLQSVSAGTIHTCGLTTGGAAYCWGGNSGGSLGDGTTATRLVPVPVNGGPTFQWVGAGGVHSCGLTTGSVAYCWGFNGTGALGDGTLTTALTPTAVVGGLTFQGLGTGTVFTCGVTTNGAAYCWGSGANGQLGNGVTFSPPVRVVGF